MIAFNATGKMFNNERKIFHLHHQNASTQYIHENEQAAKHWRPYPLNLVFIGNQFMRDQGGIKWLHEGICLECFLHNDWDEIKCPLI